MKFFEIVYPDGENRRCLINSAHLISVEMNESSHGGYYNVIITTSGDTSDSSRTLSYISPQDALNAYVALQTVLVGKEPEKVTLL